MAYQLVAAKARSKGLDATWSDVNITAVTIGALFSTYANVWLTLSHPALQTNVYLELNTMREALSSAHHRMTIPEYLISIGDDALPTVPSLPELRLRRVRYNDAWRAGYDIKPVDRFRHEDADIPHGEKDDLLLRKAGVDFQTYHRYVMVSVNGFFHRTGTYEDGLQVVEGGRTGRMCNSNQVGIHSFFGVGTIDQIPITADMIYKTISSGRLADRAYIELPYDTEDRTILLVVGGYLHVLDDTYVRIGPRSIRINFNKIAFPERYFESRNRIDLSSLPLNLNEDNPGHVGVDELHSDEVIKAYLSLPQSYVVIVNAKDFFVRRHPVPNPQLPGRYEVPADTERLPLFGTFGRLADYAIFPDWGRHVLACQENARPRFGFRTTDWRANETIDDSLYPYRPWDWTQAHMLEMGRFA